MPPIANENIKLYISNPVVAARLNNDGGFQYSGTNIGSVNPKGAVRMLAQSISFLSDGLAIQITSHIPKRINENTSQGFNNDISIFTFDFYLLHL